MPYNDRRATHLTPVRRRSPEDRSTIFGKPCRKPRPKNMPKLENNGWVSILNYHELV